jgi:hypothetical protein
MQTTKAIATLIGMTAAEVYGQDVDLSVFKSTPEAVPAETTSTQGIEGTATIETPRPAVLVPDMPASSSIHHVLRKGKFF